MRCRICNAVLSEPRFNADHKDYEPCERCLSVIQDTLDGFRDTPAAPEDSLGGPDPILVVDLSGAPLESLWDDSWQSH